MVEGKGTHAGRQAKRKSQEINPYNLTVKFAPELRGHLQDVINAVRYSPHFDGDSELIECLKSFADGTDAPMVVRLMKDITEGIAAHTEATKDVTAQKAWEEFSMQLIDPPDRKPPFMLVQREQGRGV